MRASFFAAAAIAAAGAVAAPALAADKTTLVVLAASSSRSAILQLDAAFEKAHPDVAIAPQFAGSKVIAAQIQQGAAGDVVLITEGVARSLGGALDGVTPVMRNHTAIIVWKGAAGKIHGAADLVAKGVRLGGGTPGSAVASFDGATLEKLAKDEGANYPQRYAANVIALKTDNGKLSADIAAGAVDAAILFPSDAVAGASIEVPLPQKDRVEETHAVGVVKASTHADLAHAYAAMLASPQGAAIFSATHHDPVR